LHTSCEAVIFESGNPIKRKQTQGEEIFSNTHTYPVNRECFHMCESLRNFDKKIDALFRYSTPMKSI
jgi:hypothetical protein